ncbi:MAG TPA: hypothetical protein VN112_07760 [Ensifer sp.]|nr:hypothetical protein [Ensifer sp.]
MRAFLRSLIVIVLPLLVLTGCGEEYDWNQKLRVSVETPNGVIMSSSVSHVKLVDVRGMLADGHRVNSFVTGEAVVIPLDRGRYLFALMDGLPQLNWLVYQGVDAAEVGKRFEDGNDGGAGAVTVPKERYPLLVTFDDINNPASVKRVDPANLEATFGPGYRLNGITLSLTKEPVTKGEVEKVLGWWCEYRTKSARLNGSTTSAISTNELPDVLGTGAFRVGDCSL